MAEFFRSWIYSLLASGCVCSILLLLNPDSKMKSLLETGCACIMVLTFLTPFDEVQRFDDYFQRWEPSDAYVFDYSEYTKSFMESEYRAYILNEAEHFGINLTDLIVSTVQDENGNWIPYEVSYISESPIPSEFQAHIFRELGITEERQYENEENTVESNAGR